MESCITKDWQSCFFFFRTAEKEDSKAHKSTIYRCKEQEWKQSWDKYKCLGSSEGLRSILRTLKGPILSSGSGSYHFSVHFRSTFSYTLFERPPPMSAQIGRLSRAWASTAHGVSASALLKAVSEHWRCECFCPSLVILLQYLYSA